MGVKCFLLEPSNRARRALRRYSRNGACPGPYSYHNAENLLDEVEAGGKDDVTREPEGNELQLNWPVKCASCPYEFQSADAYQINCDRLWTRDTGEFMTLADAPAGAMWNADWYEGQTEWTGPDGRAIVVKCPNGRSWNIDSRASNCDSPCASCHVAYNNHRNTGAKSPTGQSCEHYKESRPHKCWIRHGEPPNLTVDKQGVTCGAGAGSIQAGDYHGFLRNGEFT